MFNNATAKHMILDLVSTSAYDPPPSAQRVNSRKGENRRKKKRRKKKEEKKTYTPSSQINNT
jgi:hypothetical protein